MGPQNMRSRPTGARSPAASASPWSPG